MSETIDSENPQDLPHTRLFLISPRPVFFTRLCIAPDHPAAGLVVVMSPHLPYERWFEGWRLTWRTKAKHDFLESFHEFWRSDDVPLEVASPMDPEFLRELASRTSEDEFFDAWWTMQDRVDLIRIDEDWRPS